MQGICTICGNKQKQLFSSFYCDCQDSKNNPEYKSEDTYSYKVAYINGSTITEADATNLGQTATAYLDKQKNCSHEYFSGMSSNDIYTCVKCKHEKPVNKDNWRAQIETNYFATSFDWYKGRYIAEYWELFSHRRTSPRSRGSRQKYTKGTT